MANMKLEEVYLDERAGKRYRVYPPRGSNAEPYIGEAVDCKELMELHGYTAQRPLDDAKFVPPTEEAQQPRATQPQAKRG